MRLYKEKPSDYHGEISTPETIHFSGAWFGRIYSCIESNGRTRHERLSDTMKLNLSD